MITAGNFQLNSLYMSSEKWAENILHSILQVKAYRYWKKKRKDVCVPRSIFRAVKAKILESSNVSAGRSKLDWFRQKTVLVMGRQDHKCTIPDRTQQCKLSWHGAEWELLGLSTSYLNIPMVCQWPRSLVNGAGKQGMACKEGHMAGQSELQFTQAGRAGREKSLSTQQVRQ